MVSAVTKVKSNLINVAQRIMCVNCKKNADLIVLKTTKIKMSSLRIIYNGKQR